mmetsp:Transcript_19810/g.35849  ORF Transcript_19810/g.35849 Transcript_19810/m.35849 type:complete len:110 (-) Transcript_19810:206-535(-)
MQKTAFEKLNVLVEDKKEKALLHKFIQQQQDAFQQKDSVIQQQNETICNLSIKKAPRTSSTGKFPSDVTFMPAVSESLALTSKFDSAATGPTVSTVNYDIMRAKNEEVE